MSLHVCSYYRQKHRTQPSSRSVDDWTQTKVLLCDCTDKISSWSSFSIQMARSFSGAYENNVVPAILVGLLIVCHPPGAICQGPLVPEPCAEALPRAPTSLTPIMPPHMAPSLSIMLIPSSLWDKMALLYWYFRTSHVTSLFGSRLRMSFRYHFFATTARD